MSAATETRKFEAEVAQVLHLVTHSLYSNKDVFLRELVSNASDACDKLRFEAVADPARYGETAELRIEISFDKAARTLTVRDTGIGMNREELIENLGTVARSGTRRFLEALSESQKADAALIGQFGVGFYSAFVVAERVEVVTRRAGEEQAWRWASDGAGEYTLEPAELDRHGTAVTLHLKQGEDEYLDRWKLRSLVQKYSDHVGFPILLPKQPPAGDSDGDESETADATPELETINQASALWTRQKSELKDEDYQNFYRHVSHDFGDALAWTHNRVEGNQNFTSLLYVPARAPLDFMMGRDERQGLKLYVKRVFIMDAAGEMLPNYLRFMRGVVDSDDLPLNVSREILQHNRQVERIKGALTKRTLDLLERLAGDELLEADAAGDGEGEDADGARKAGKYRQFWSQFGNVLKEGVVEDTSNRERIAKLLRFPSTRSDTVEQLVSLDTYLGRMKAGQDAIYFLTADGWNAARNSPQLEALKAAGVEVLLMHERIDEWMAGYLSEYQGKPLRNIAKSELPESLLGERKDDAPAGERDAIVERVKALLGERVGDVRASRRLTESAACLVLQEHDMALHMQRLLRAAGQDVPAARPVLEVNPSHPLLARLNGEQDEARARALALVVFEQAQLAEGVPLEDPAGFLKRVNALIAPN